MWLNDVDLASFRVLLEQKLLASRNKLSEKLLKRNFHVICGLKAMHRTLRESIFSKSRFTDLFE